MTEQLADCVRCGISKPFTAEFFRRGKDCKSGLSKRCLECARAYMREWQRRFRATEAGRAVKRECTRRWEASPEGRAKLLAAKSAWREKNREMLRAKTRARRAAETPEQRRKRMDDGVAYLNRRRKADPVLRLRFVVSSRISTALKTRGTSKRARNWEKLVGYSLADLKSHIERQFIGRMSWDNYGKWHVDHIVPVASFRWRSADDAEFKACWALSNLRPLWAAANRSKKDKRLYLI